MTPLNEKVSKEDFNWIWKDTPKETVLNQLYYEHYELIDAQQQIAELQAEVQEANDNAAWWHNRYIALGKQLKEIKERKNCENK